MKSDYKRLGDYIQLVDFRNRDLSITFLRGIATSKQLIESNANMTGVSLSNYKIVGNRQFVYTSDTSRRGDRIALALNTGVNCVVSSIYTVFKVVDENALLPEFLFLWFQRTEFDRYTRFHSWGSARETFDWADMCDVSLPIPDIDEQRKYVTLYKALQKNQQAYEKTIDDLQLICDTFLEALKNSEPNKLLGDYIYQSDERNGDLNNDNLRAISVDKKFMASKSDKNKLNLASYKLIHPRQFGYVTVTSRNGEKISIAILEGKDCIVSSTYCVFGVTDTSVLLPEYLFLWFKRTEFDRYARFHSSGSARETFDWADMCNVTLPIPGIEIQESIVAIHHTLETRKRLNIQLKSQIQKLCPILMRGVVENMA
ncbi:MAG: restriction endonuclease subunit S [Chlorobium sp.]|nr:MAG: restriction endonuclease subunit S [Chlorobium sp.]